MLMETVISVGKPHYQVQIPSDAANLDKLNFLAGKRVDEVNKMAELGTQICTRRRRSAEYEGLYAGFNRSVYRATVLFLRIGLWYLRKYVGRESIRPTRSGSL